MNILVNYADEYTGIERQAVANGEIKAREPNIKIMVLWWRLGDETKYFVLWAD